MSTIPRPGRNLSHRVFMVQGMERRKADQWVYVHFCTKLATKQQIKNGPRKAAARWVSYPSFILLSTALLHFLLPYFICIVENLLSIGEVQARLAMFVKLVGQAQQKAKGPLAMDSNWGCYLNSNTSRQVQQIRREQKGEGGMCEMWKSPN